MRVDASAKALGEPEQAAAEPDRQAGEVVPVSPNGLAGWHVVGEGLHHGLELVGHGRDHRLQEGGDKAERYQNDHQDGQSPTDMPAHQHADSGVQADRQEQGDQRPDQHVASSVRCRCHGGRSPGRPGLQINPSGTASSGACGRPPAPVKAAAAAEPGHSSVHAPSPATNHAPPIRPVSTTSWVTAIACPSAPNVSSYAWLVAYLEPKVTGAGAESEVSACGRAQGGSLGAASLCAMPWGRPFQLLGECPSFQHDCAVSHQGDQRYGRRVLLIDRRAEKQALHEVLDSVRAGMSGALVLQGEPGAGKSALLDYAVEGAAGLHIFRTVTASETALCRRDAGRGL